MKFYDLFCSLILACCLATVSFAQEEDVLRPHGKPLTAEEKSKFSWENHPEKLPLTIGVEGGLNYNMFTQSLQRGQPLASSVEDVLQTGAGISPTFGVLADWTISGNVALQLGVGFDMKSYSHSLDGKIEFFDPNTNADYEENISAEYSAKVSYLYFAPALRYNVTERLFFLVGLQIQSMMGNLERTDKLSVVNSTHNGSFTTDYLGNSVIQTSITRTITTSSNMLPPITQPTGQFSSVFMPYSTSRLAFEAGLGYLFPIANTVALAAQMRYQFMINALNDTYIVTDNSLAPLHNISNVTYSDAKIHSAQFVLGLWFKIM